MKTTKHTELRWGMRRTWSASGAGRRGNPPDPFGACARARGSGLLFRSVFSVCSVVMLLCAPVRAAQFGYQGRIVVNGTNYDGTGYFKFALVNSGESLSRWSNDGTSTAGSEPSNSVPLAVSKGLFSVAVGDLSVGGMMYFMSNSVLQSADVTLKVWFSPSNSAFAALSPNVQIVAGAAYAAFAERADGVKEGGISAGMIGEQQITGTAIADGAVGQTKITDGAVYSAKLADNAVTSLKIADGVVTAAKLATNISISTTGGIAAGSFTGNGSGLTNLSVSASGIATGTLADARLSTNVPRLNASQTFSAGQAVNGTLNVNAGQLYVNGFVGIGTTIPTATLDVAGAALFRTNFSVLGSTLVVNATNGRVGVGTGAPSQALEVNGNLSATGTISAANFSGNGAGLTNVSVTVVTSIVTTVTNAIADSQLSTNVARLNAAQVFSAQQSFGGNVVVGSKLTVDSSTNQFALQLTSANNAGTWFTIANTQPTGRSWQLVSTAPGNGEGSGKLLIRDSVGGTRATFSTNGHLGLNTVFPTQALDVNGNINATGSLFASQFVGNGGSLTNLNAANLTGFVADARLPTNIARLASSPSFTGTVSATALAVSNNNNQMAAQLLSTSTVGSWLQLQNTSPGGGAWSFISTGSANGEGAGKLLFYLDAPRLLINSNGFVGINTTAPQQMLDVNGNITATGSISAASFSGAFSATSITGNAIFSGHAGSLSNLVVDPTGVSSGTLEHALVFGHVNAGEGISSKYTPGGNQYGLDFYAGTSRRMSIWAGGNIGVGTGTNAPTHLLEVSGTFSAYNLSGNGSGIYSLNASNIASGNLADARLSTNVALLTGSPSFAGTVAATGVLVTNGGQVALQLQGGGNSGTGQRIQNTSTGGRSWTLLATGAGNGEGPGRLLIQDTTAGQTRLTISTNGHIGIGAGSTNTSPANLLTVSNAYCDGNTWVNASDRNLKEHFAPVDTRRILEKVAALPITEWSYKSDAASVKHIGPMAQDFYAAFRVGGGDTSISTIDPAGISLAAIQALNAEVSGQKSEVENLRAENAALKALLEKLGARLDALESGR